MIKTVIRGAFWQLVITLLIISTTALIAATWLGNKIFSPPRRALQSYHLKHLQHPRLYGLQIQSYGCLKGKVPCLLVEADPKKPISRRGKRLRRQVSAKGVHLSKYGQTRGMIVLLHGRNGRKEDLLPVAERFVAAGFRCLIPDLPAHGDSPISSMTFGSSDFEHSLTRLIVKDARQHFKLPKEPVNLWGISMGGAFAISAASESPNFWNALVVVSSFGQLNQVMDKNLSKKWRPFAPIIHLFLNTSQLLRGRPITNAMTPQQWAKQVKIPTLIVHGNKDPFIPLSQGKELYAAVNSSQKRWLTVPRGGHGNVLKTAMPLYAEMSVFYIRH